MNTRSIHILHLFESQVYPHTKGMNASQRLIGRKREEILSKDIVTVKGLAIE